MSSRYFVPGKRGTWTGRCEVLEKPNASGVVTQYYRHHADWPIKVTKDCPFGYGQSLEYLIDNKHWVEVFDVDPDLEVDEGL